MGAGGSQCGHSRHEGQKTRLLTRKQPQRSAASQPEGGLKVIFPVLGTRCLCSVPRAWVFPVASELVRLCLPVAEFPGMTQAGRSDRTPWPTGTCAGGWPAATASAGSPSPRTPGRRGRFRSSENTGLACRAGIHRAARDGPGEPGSARTPHTWTDLAEAAVFTWVDGGTRGSGSRSKEALGPQMTGGRGLSGRPARRSSEFSRSARPRPRPRGQAQLGGQL